MNWVSRNTITSRKSCPCNSLLQQLPPPSPRLSKPTREVPLYGAILLPPLVIAVTDPDIFFAALDNAGTFGISLLCGVLPAAMAWSQRYSDANRFGNRSGDWSGDQEQGEYEDGVWCLATLPLVPGGKATLAGVCVCVLPVFVINMRHNTRNMHRNEMNSI